MDKVTFYKMMKTYEIENPEKYKRSRSKKLVYRMRFGKEVFRVKYSLN